MKFTGQIAESRKARVPRWTTKTLKPSARARKAKGERQEGRLWEQKMQSVALRLPQGRARRDRSGAPMKHGDGLRKRGRA